MARLAHLGIVANLPDGFEGTIFRRGATPGAETYPVAHFATFARPAGTGDFGGEATAVMRPSDIFAALFEYGPESLGKALFSRTGIPRALTADNFHSYVLRRGASGQAGTQWFFTESERPFSLFVVLGSYLQRAVLVPRVNDLLRGIHISGANVPVAS
jgi:hypothetical protein